MVHNGPLTVQQAQHYHWTTLEQMQVEWISGVFPGISIKHEGANLRPAGAASLTMLCGAVWHAT